MYPLKQLENWRYFDVFVWISKYFKEYWSVHLLLHIYFVKLNLGKYWQNAATDKTQQHMFNLVLLKIRILAHVKIRTTKMNRNQFKLNQCNDVAGNWARFFLKVSRIQYQPCLFMTIKAIAHILIFIFRIEYSNASKTNPYF